MTVKVWNGSSWVSAIGLKVWNGSSWVSTSNGKVWNGSAWTTFFSSGATVTTGSYTDMFGGGKGTEYYTKQWTGFNNASPEGNPPNFGSISGTVKDGYSPVIQCYHYFATYEVSPTETEFTVVVTGNLTGSYSLQVDGTTVTSPTTGTYSSGPNTTYFNWTGVSSTSPFGSNGTTHIAKLV